MAENTENTTTLTPATPAIKFKYGDLELDANKLAKYLHDNALGWLLHSGYGNNAEVQSAINDMIGRIQSGDIDSLDYAGNMHSKTDYTNNSELKHLINFPNGKGIIRTGKTEDTHGIAAYYLNEALMATNPSGSSSSTTKEKYSNDGLHKAWINKYFGGLESTPDNIEAAWYNRDAKDEKTGQRGRTNRLNEYANFLLEYANSDAVNNYDYEGSAFKDAADYRARLIDAAEAARSGSWDSFIRAYAAAGGTDLDILFAQGDAKASEDEDNEYETALEEYLKGLPPDISPEQKAKLTELFRNLYMLEKYGDYYSQIADDEYKSAYEDWATKHYLGHGSDTLQSLGTTKYSDEEREFWYGNNSLDEGDRTEGYFGDSGHQLYALGLLNRIMSGLQVSGTAASGKANSDILRAYMYALKTKDPDNFKNNTTAINANEYFLNDSFDINNGTGIKYNFKTRQFIRVHVDPTNTPKLAAALKAKWQKTHKKQKSKYAAKQYTWAKNGAKLHQLQMLRLGDTFALAYSNDLQKRYDAAVLKEMDATGKTKKQVELGHTMASTPLNWKDSKRSGMDSAKLNTSDYLRLGSALTDLASIGVSYTGAGMPVAAAMQLGSVGADLAADVIDPSKSWGEVIKNTAMNVGLGAATAVGGGMIAKAGKLGKTIKTLLPVALAGWGMSGLLEDPNFKGTWKKIEKGKFSSFTSNDLKNLSMLTKIVAGGHNGMKSAAGALGTEFGNTNSVAGRVARGAGKWGNNAWKLNAGAVARALRILEISKSHPKAVSKLAQMKAKNTLAKQGNYNQMMTLIEEGGFKKGAVPKVEANGKVKVGGVEVERETYNAMEAARKKASAVAGAKEEDIKSAILDAYRNSKEGKTVIKAGQPEKAAHTVKAFTAANADEMATALTPLPEGSGFKINDKVFEGTRNFKNTALGEDEIAAGDLGPKLQEVYKTAADKVIARPGETPEQLAAAKHTAGLTEVNKIFGELFNTEKIEPTPETGMPNFLFENLKGNLGKFDIRRFGGRGKLEVEDNSPGLLTKAYRAINPKTADRFDISTEEGKANVELLRKLRRNSIINGSIWGDDWNSDVLFNLGFGFKTPTKFASYETVTPVEENTNKPVVTPDEPTVTPGVEEITDDIYVPHYDLFNNLHQRKNPLKEVSTNFSNPVVSRAPATKTSTLTPLTLIKDLRTIKHNNKLRNSYLNKFLEEHPNSEYLEGGKRHDFNGMLIDPNGEYIKWKLGGKLNKLKSLRSGGSLENFTKDTPKIIKASSGVKFTNANNTWRNDIFRIYMNDILDRLKKGGDNKANWYNTMQHRHSQMYNAAGGNVGDWQNTAYTGNIDGNENFISQYQTDYDNADLAGYNSGYDTVTGKNNGYDAIGQAYKNGRYTVNGKRISGDAPGHKFKADNLYSAITDDRRLLGRLGDWDEKSLDYTDWQNKLKEVGYEMYLDPSDKYYKLRRTDGLNIGETTENPVQNLNVGGSNTTATEGSTTKATPGKEKNAGSKSPYSLRGFLGKLAKGLNEDVDPYALALMGLGYATNKKLELLGLLSRTALLSHTPKHLQIMGQYSKLQRALSGANDLESAGARVAANTSDASLGIAAMLESQLNAEKARNSAYTDYDEGVQNSILRSVQLEFANVDLADEDRNKNAALLADLSNEHLKTRMGRIEADFNGITKPWLMELSYNRKAKIADAKNNAIELAKLKAQRRKQLALAGPYLEMQLAYNSDDLKKYDEAYKKYTLAASDYELNHGWEDDLDYYRAYGLDTSELENMKNESPYTFSQTGSSSGTGYKFGATLLTKKGGKLAQLVELKTGGSTIKDDGRRKTRSKDLDRLQKAIESAAKSHDKVASEFAKRALVDLRFSFRK